MRTKSVLLTLLAILFMNLHAAAQDPIKQGHNGKRILVAYFSATGTTAEAAKKLARVTGGELYAITPAKPYTNADLDWHNKQSRSSVEMNDLKSRPVLKNKKENIADYEVIFIGCASDHHGGGELGRLRHCIHRLSHLVESCTSCCEHFH